MSHDAKQTGVVVHAAYTASTNADQKSELEGRRNGRRLHGVLVFPHGRVIQLGTAMSFFNIFTIGRQAATL